jgi:hypothetical protein
MSEIQYEDNLKKEFLGAIRNHQTTLVRRRVTIVSSVSLVILLLALGGAFVSGRDRPRPRDSVSLPSQPQAVQADSWLSCSGAATDSKLRMLMRRETFDAVVVGVIENVGASRQGSSGGRDHASYAPIQVQVTQVLRGGAPDNMVVFAAVPIQRMFVPGQRHLIGIETSVDGTSLATGCPLGNG